MPEPKSASTNATNLAELLSGVGEVVDIGIFYTKPYFEARNEGMIRDLKVEGVVEREGGVIIIGRTYSHFWKIPASFSRGYVHRIAVAGTDLVVYEGREHRAPSSKLLSIPIDEHAELQGEEVTSQLTNPFLEELASR